METTTIQPEEQARPQFLKVLCILTFIGVGIMLVVSLFGINKTFLQTEEERATVRLETVEKVLQMNPEADEAYVEHILMEGEKYETMNWLIGVTCNILTLLGAILMWQMKKTGFYFYSAGELLTYVLPVIFGGLDSFKASMEVGSIWGGMAEKIGLAVFAAVIIFDITFIILYALNLKHLK